MNTQGNKLISKKEAAEILGVSVRTIERMLLNGEVTKVKVRGSVRIRLNELNEYLEPVPA
jgi:excisionase family DNA binding protein